MFRASGSFEATVQTQDLCCASVLKITFFQSEFFLLDNRKCVVRTHSAVFVLGLDDRRAAFLFKDSEGEDAALRDCGDNKQLL